MLLPCCLECSQTLKCFASVPVSLLLRGAMDLLLSSLDTNSEDAKSSTLYRGSIYVRLHSDSLLDLRALSHAYSTR